jgi:hypothetical protein
MGAKVTFNEITKVIEITQAPDVNGDINISVKADLYSDGKEDWVANENLRKFYFPIEAIGGNPLPGAKDLGTTFFLASDWKIQPYGADHRLIIDGNLYAEDGSDPFLDADPYTVRIMQQVSDLVSTVSSGSGLSQEEHDQLFALPDEATIADEVWEEDISDHTNQGTFGNELATKSDLKASSSTNYNTAISGTAVYGTVESGDYQSTQQKDNTYWQIEEDGTNGIIIELTFNLPDDAKPGQVSVFGRYIGVPSTTHYINLWAYNYESVSLELLADHFMPGGMTSDQEYSHEFYERNIDRTNNNEVKIRLIHNPTTYNVSHDLFLDRIMVSSIDIITAEEIADAVWQHQSSIDLTNYIIRSLGLAQENFVMDQQVYQDYNGAKLLTSARIRTYQDAAKTQLIATYAVTASWSNGACISYQCLKQ